MFSHSSARQSVEDIDLEEHPHHLSPQAPDDPSVEHVPYRQAWSVEHNVRPYIYFGFTAISPLCASAQVIQHLIPGSEDYGLAAIMVVFNACNLIIPFVACVVNPYVEDWSRSAQSALQGLEALNVSCMLTSIACGSVLASRHSNEKDIFTNTLVSICLSAWLFFPMALTAYRSRTYGRVRPPGAPAKKIVWDAHAWVGVVFWTSICSLVLSATAAGFAGAVLANDTSQSSRSAGAWIALIVFAAQGVLFSIWFVALSHPFRKVPAVPSSQLLKRALMASLWTAICSLPAVAIAPFWMVNIGCQKLDTHACDNIAGYPTVVLGLQVADTALRLTLPYCIFKCMSDSSNSGMTSTIRLEGLNSTSPAPKRRGDDKAQAVVESQEHLTQHASPVGQAAFEERPWEGRRGISRSSSRASGVDVARPASIESDEIRVAEPYSKKQA